MGREIEIKIPLADSQYEKIYKAIFGEDEFAHITFQRDRIKKYRKSDEYYSRYDSRAESKAAGEPQVIRIRSEEIAARPDSEAFEKADSYFCIKRKVIENGIELNREDETFVQDASVIRDLLTLSGYHKFFEKIKNTISVMCTCDLFSDIPFHAELEIVNEMKYLEVEVTEGEQVADTVRQSLTKWMELFELDPSKRDSRSWMEIIQGGVR